MFGSDKQTMVDDGGVYDFVAAAVQHKYLATYTLNEANHCALAIQKAIGAKFLYH